MKKVLSLFLLISVFILIFLIPANKAFADGLPIIIPERLKVSGTPFNASTDISFFGDRVSILKQTTSQDSYEIVEYNMLPNDLNAEPVRVIDLKENVEHLVVYNDKYFYASNKEIFTYTDIAYVNEKNYIANSIPLENFYEISDLVISSKSLFLIGKRNASDTTSVYKFNDTNFDDLNFDDLNFDDSYNNIKNLAYSEVAKKTFIYNGLDVSVIETKATIYSSTEIIDIFCDFEGNLYIIENNQIIKYGYIDDYSESKIFQIKYAEETNDNLIAYACFKHTGQILILCNDVLGENLVSNVYFIPKNIPEIDWSTTTSNDIPNIPEFKNLKLSELSELDFYAAEITGYPSNRLYPTDIKIGGTTVSGGGPESIEEIPIKEKVLVFKTSVSEKFSYVLYKNKFAVVYNNSLTKVGETAPQFTEAEVFWPASNIYSIPSNFIYKNNLEYSFIKDEIALGSAIRVLGEIELYKTTYCRINYGNNFEKTGYINKKEISEPFKIKTFNPTPGRIDSNKDIPLYEDSNILSATKIMLSHKQPITILKRGDEFCYIQVEINGILETGYVQTQFVLESGLTKLQKIGLWILISAVLLTSAAILLRVFLVRRKKNKH